MDKYYHFEDIQKCFRQIIKKYPYSKEDLEAITNNALILQRGPAIIFIIDLLRRVPTLKLKDLSLNQQDEYKELLSWLKYSSVRFENLPGQKLWEWWDTKESPIPNFLEIKFRRLSSKNTQIELALRDKEHDNLHLDALITTGNRANNLLRYLLKEGLSTIG